MKASFLLLCAIFLSGAILSSCKTTSEDDTPPPLKPIETTRPVYHESATPSRPETPEDFRAVTPPSSYSR